MLIKLILFFVVIFAADRFLLWLEAMGWLFYRKRKSPGGFVGNALLELNSLFQPSARHVMELKQNKICVKNSEDNAGDDKDTIEM